MAFDGFFLHHLTKELKYLEQGKINKIYQIDEYSFIFQIKKNSLNSQLLISLHPEQYRIQITKLSYDKPQNPSNLTMFLRKHLECGTIKNIKQFQNDRIIMIDIVSQNELRDYENKCLIIELMGRYNNLILTLNNKIIQAYKYICNPLENSRLIALNLNYEPPIQNKINPFLFEISNIKDIQGISKEAIVELERRNLSLEDLKSIVKPIIYKLENKYLFYFTYLPSLKADYIIYDSLSEMLDNYFTLKENKIKSNQKFNSIYHLLKRTIDKNLMKLDKLSIDLRDANNKDIYKEYGDLLFNCFDKLNEHLDSISTNSYKNNIKVDITLDKSKTVKENALLFYKKYKKKKNSILFINEQIEKTKQEIEYLNLLLEQLDIANLNDLLEIEEELKENNYIKSNKKSSKKKNKKPSFLCYYDSLGNQIYVGKNNIQNDYITNKLAKPEDMWMHVANSPSSHILIKATNHLEEVTIRTGAMLASYYSKYRHSSSVMVNYTLKKNLRKVKGKANCFVTYNTYRSIYIDPDEFFINNLKKKN